jgi:hypothetical protein
VHVVDATLLGAADRVAGAIAKEMVGEASATVTSIVSRRRPALSQAQTTG